MNSRLRFQLFDFVWWCDQHRGTQQGGSHSPTLFGRIVAARFEQLAASWSARGERPAFSAGLLALWGLWFIDDSILLFRCLSQAVRLMPEVSTMLATLGLSINVSKSCVLGVPLSSAPLPGFLAPFPVVLKSVYLGLPFQLVEDDAHMVDKLCAKATAAFFSNRLLLTNRSASRCHRLRLFNSLVTATLRWSLCALSVKQSTLHRLRVHCVTLLTWLLGGRAHPSWFSVECLQALRHGVKLWGRTYSELWDSLLARMVWQWVGHVLRMAPSTLPRSVLLDLQPASQQRRCRTGPNNSGHRTVLRYLQHHNIPTQAATDRHHWSDLEDRWIRHHGINLPTCPKPNVWFVRPDQHIWARRCLQGSYSGQQLFVCDVTDAVHQCCFELDRICGWRKFSFIGGCLYGLLEGIVQTNWIRPGTFHIRVLLFQRTPGWEHIHCLLSANPVVFGPFCKCQIVAEISALPTAWSSWMTRLATELVC